jgi:GntR family transcriptional repressor for pyruvate dehydrogenase complex
MTSENDASRANPGPAPDLDTQSEESAAANGSAEAEREKPVFKGIRRIQRSQQVRDQIESAIARGAYRPGDRLPSERELTEQFGVSRVVVREAMRSLEALGLVEVHQGRGYFVAESLAGRYVAPFEHYLDIHRDEILELVNVRGALDELAAAEAASRYQPADPGMVRQAQEAFRRGVDNDTPLEDLLHLDVEFHLAIGRASGSALLTSLLAELHEHMRDSRRITLAARERRQRSAAEHERIVAAIESGEPTAAREAVRSHIASVRQDLLKRNAGAAEAS